MKFEFVARCHDSFENAFNGKELHGFVISLWEKFKQFGNNINSSTSLDYYYMYYDPVDKDCLKHKNE